jgi:hypothetical protein
LVFLNTGRGQGAVMRFTTRPDQGKKAAFSICNCVRLHPRILPKISQLPTLLPAARPEPLQKPPGQ